jgi:serine/threonine-protein kinase
VLVTIGTIGAFDNATIAAVSLKTGEVKNVLSGGYFGRYLPSGHLIYIHQDVLFALPFDARRLRTRGTPVPIPEEVRGNTAAGGGPLDFSLGPAGHGMLVYLSSLSGGSVTNIVWLEPAGKKTLLKERSITATPRLSPDGKNLALSIALDIFNYDIQRGVMRRLTSTGAGNRFPVWAPDGRHIAYSAGSGGIWWTASDSSTPQRILEVKGLAAAESFSPDGKLLAYNHAGTGIFVLPLDIGDPDHPKPGQPELFQRTPAAAANAAFSPDGRWLAYDTSESGSYQVFVRRYPPGGTAGQTQISTTTGRFPVWSRNGKELFYETMDGHIMVADYSVKGETFIPGTPRRWTETPALVAGVYPNFDLSPDTKRIVAFSAPEAAGGAGGSLRATFLVNFFDELKRKVP